MYCGIKNTLLPIGKRVFFWQGQKDSNPQERFWRPLCYHYIMPLMAANSIRGQYITIPLKKKQALFVNTGTYRERL